MRRETLTAYGEPLDREMLTVLAEQDGVSSSTWIVQHIRKEYERLYGNAPPEILRKKA